MPGRNTHMREHRTGGAEQVLAACDVPTIPPQPEPVRECGCPAHESPSAERKAVRAKGRIQRSG